jgi:hypothetical protein
MHFTRQYSHKSATSNDDNVVNNDDNGTTDPVTMHSANGGKKCVCV